MSVQRLAEIVDLLARAERRMSPERAFALLTACRELVAEAARVGT